MGQPFNIELSSLGSLLVNGINVAGAILLTIYDPMKIGGRLVFRAIAYWFAVAVLTIICVLILQGLVPTFFKIVPYSEPISRPEQDPNYR